MYGKTIITGRLTRDPETKPAGDTTVTRFTVAVDDGYGEKKTTDFYNCAAWGARGKNVETYTKKGSVVLVEGKMKSSKKEDKTYWELRADEVKFLSSDGNNSGGGGGQQQQPQYQQQTQQYQQQPQYQQQAQPQYQQVPQQQYQQNPYAQQQPQGNPYAQQQQQYSPEMFAGAQISDDNLPF